MGDPTNVNQIVFGLGDVIGIVVGLISIFSVYSALNAKNTKVDAKLDMFMQYMQQYIKDHETTHTAIKEQFNGHVAAYMKNIDEFTKKIETAKNDIYRIIVSIQKMENKVLKTLLDETSDNE